MQLELNFDRQLQFKIIDFICPLCNKEHSIMVEEDVYDKYQFYKNNYHFYRIQEILPNICAEHREMMISGCCKDCQTAVFGEENE